MSLSQIKDVAVSGVYALYYVNSWVKSWFASPSLTMEETIAQLECVREKVYQREKNLREQMEEHRSLAIEYAKNNKKRERKNKNDDAIHRAAAGSGQETDATKARAKVEGQRPKVKGRERRERTFARTERLL